MLPFFEHLSQNFFFLLAYCTDDDYSLSFGAQLRPDGGDSRVSLVVPGGSDRGHRRLHVGLCFPTNQVEVKW